MGFRAYPKPSVLSFAPLLQFPSVAISQDLRNFGNIVDSMVLIQCAIVSLIENALTLVIFLPVSDTIRLLQSKIFLF